MTDNEIINALEYIRYHLTASKHKEVIDDAIDLINRQQAEIEDLKKIKENSLEIISIGENQILEIREKSIKEFAKRLKNKWKLLFIAYPQIGESIDNLVKEMVGDTE